VSTQLENNLLNIRSTDPVYRVVVEKAVRDTLPLLSTMEKAVLSLLADRVKLVVGDSFFLHYSVSPLLRKHNDDEVLEKVRKTLEDYAGSPEYNAIHATTMHDQDTSMFHTVALTRNIMRLLANEFKEKLEDKMESDDLRKLMHELQQALQQLLPQAQGEGSGSEPTAVGAQQEGGQGGEQQGGEGGGQQQGGQQQGQNNAGASGNNMSMDELLEKMREKVVEKLREHLGEKELEEVLGEVAKSVNAKYLRAVLRANEEAETYKGVKEIGGFWAGKGGGDYTRAVSLIDQLIDSDVHRIITLGNKLANDERFTHIMKKLSRHGEIHGYKTTSNPEHAIPRELALPDELFYAKLASGSLLSKQYRTVAEGATYVLLDKSGSMVGAKTIWARSVAVALLRQAKRKKREFYLRFFDYNVHKLLVNEEAFEHLVTVESDGGTSIDTALKTAIEDLRKLRDKTNTIVLITDGLDEVTVTPEDLKRVNARLIVVHIGEDKENEKLRRLAEASGGEYVRAELTEEGGRTVLKLAR